jgi:hypothetical protein
MHGCESYHKLMVGYLAAHVWGPLTAAALHAVPDGCCGRCKADVRMCCQPY